MLIETQKLDDVCRRGWVYALKRDFPSLDFSLNGVVDSCHEAAAVNGFSHEGAQTHGVMIGRAAYHYPWQCLADADRSVFGQENHAISRRQVCALSEIEGGELILPGGLRHDKPSSLFHLAYLVGLQYSSRNVISIEETISSCLC